jgi:MraZ protein
MALISGEYPATLDEKGRLSIPAKLRDNFPDNQLVLSKGYEHCIWVYAAIPQLDAAVSRLTSALINGNGMSLVLSEGLRKRFIPHPAEIDKTGRFAVPQKLRDFASLSKDCVIVCPPGNRVEIWDSAQYKIYEEKIEKQFYEALEKMGPVNNVENSLI